MSPAPLCLKVMLAVLLLGASIAGHAQATGSKARCIAAYEDGQRLELEQSFTLARDKFAFCSSAECPTAMHQECATLLEAVRAATPLLVFRVLDESGAPLEQAVRMAVDEGAPQVLTGEPLSLDPGEYQFSFEAEGYVPVIRKVSVSGAGKPPIEVRLALACGDPASDSASPRTGPDASSPRTLALCRAQLAKRKRSSTERAVVPTPVKPAQRVKPALLIGTAAVGVLGGAGFAYFGLAARRGDHRLDACSPGCPVEAVADVRRNYLIANTALVVGLAGLVGTAVVWFTGQPAPAEPSHLSARTWDLQLGLVSTVSTRF